MLEIFPESYQEALEAMKEDYPDTYFPEICPFLSDVEKLLNDKFWK